MVGDVVNYERNVCIQSADQEIITKDLPKLKEKDLLKLKDTLQWDDDNNANNHASKYYPDRQPSSCPAEASPQRNVLPNPARIASQRTGAQQQGRPKTKTTKDVGMVLQRITAAPTPASRATYH